MTNKDLRHWRESMAYLETIVPSSGENLRRILFLMQVGKQPRVAAFGKYNHGKSTLLNALIGEDVFKVADKRQTTHVDEYLHDQVVWIDTPGLDADVSGEDDRRAMSAALESADILFLVHSAKAGELDDRELKVYKQLMRQDSNYRSKLILVLTQIDQVAPDELDEVIGRIHSQLPDLQIFMVSSYRYIRGSRDGVEKFIEASGLRELLSYFNSLKEGVYELRRKEALRLIGKARVELEELINDRQNALVGVSGDVELYERQFFSDVERAREKVLDRAMVLSLK